MQTNQTWELVTVKGHEFGSFNQIKVQVLSPDEFSYTRGKRVRVSVHTLPTSKGYWSLDGREYEVIYKKKLITLLRTEDCGLGGRKARTYLTLLGFRIS